MPEVSFDKDKTCEACVKGKQVKSSFKTIKYIWTLKPLELLHIDIFDPNQIAGLSGKIKMLLMIYPD